LFFQLISRKFEGNFAGNLGISILQRDEQIGVQKIALSTYIAKIEEFGKSRM
jgi:hypothetical protein